MFFITYKSIYNIFYSQLHDSSRHRTLYHSRVNMKKPTDQQMKQWLEAVWRDGFQKGVDGRGTGLGVPDDMPDFQDFDPRIKDGSSVKVDHSVLAPFNPCKCAARTYKDGYPVQCSRAHQDGERFCKTHLDKYNTAQEMGLNLRFGHYDGERPTHWLDKTDGEKIGWYDTKKTNSRSPNNHSTKNKKMKVGELREFLSTRLPNEHIRGLKKNELLELYEKEISSSSPESDTDTEPLESPKNIQEAVPESQEPEPEMEPEKEQEREPEKNHDPTPESQEPEPEMEPEKTHDPTPESQEQEKEQPEIHDEKSIEIENTNGSETEIERHQLTPVQEMETQIIHESPCIDPIQLGKSLDKMRATEETIDDTDPHEELIRELKSLKNSERKKRAKKSGATEDDMDAVDDADDSSQALIDLIISLESPEKPTKPVDPESDEELDEDKTNYEEITHEGVDYLEDEETGNIYNVEFKHVGKWNENNDDIIWEHDDYRRIHEATSD